MFFMKICKWDKKYVEEYVKKHIKKTCQKKYVEKYDIRENNINVQGTNVSY